MREVDGQPGAYRRKKQVSLDSGITKIRPDEFTQGHFIEIVFAPFPDAGTYKQVFSYEAWD